jgi:hypothetical protein
LWFLGVGRLQILLPPQPASREVRNERRQLQATMPLIPSVIENYRRGEHW